MHEVARVQAASNRCACGDVKGKRPQDRNNDLPIGGRGSTNRAEEAKEGRKAKVKRKGMEVLLKVKKEFFLHGATVQCSSCRTWTGKPKPQPVDVLTGCQGRFAGILAFACCWPCRGSVLFRSGLLPSRYGYTTLDRGTVGGGKPQACMQRT